MNKNYIIFSFLGLLIIGLLGWFLTYLDVDFQKKSADEVLLIGQKLWTYNMNKHIWRDYEQTDDDNSKDEIILQVQEPEGSGGYTSYHLITGNGQVPKEDVWMGEGSQEFIVDKKLYSYFPKLFEYYEIVFNGVKFVPRKLSDSEITDLFKGYNIIKVSQITNNDFYINYKKSDNKYILLNDKGENFYKYYIIPNDADKMKIGKFSNQFIVLNHPVKIDVQRLEGCSKFYPCFSIQVK